MICEIICIDRFLCMSHLDIVHMLSAHVHVICLSSLILLIYPIIHNLVSIHIVSTHAHCQFMCILSTDVYVMYISFLLLLSAYVHVICILSEHMHIMRTLSAVVLDIFLPNRQCRCHPYVISSTLYISYHVQLSFCTLSAQIHIAHVICMLSTHVHIICLSSLPLFIYLIIQNLVSHIVYTHAYCRCHLYTV